MELTIDQKDSLTELINIGYGRAAAALSELTGYRITLEVPQVTVHEIQQIAPVLEQVITHDVASVTQAFNGPIAGQALLLLDEHAAVSLSQLLVEDRGPGGEMDASAREIITEVGNILLNACLGVFGNLLKIQVSFAVPRINVASIRRVFEGVGASADEQVSHGLMIHTRFYLRANDVTGYMVIVLGVTSLDRLLREVSRWENRQLD